MSVHDEHHDRVHVGRRSAALRNIFLSERSCNQLKCLQYLRIRTGSSASNASGDHCNDHVRHISDSHGESRHDPLEPDDMRDYSHGELNDTARVVSVINNVCGGIFIEPQQLSINETVFHINGGTGSRIRVTPQ